MDKIPKRLTRTLYVNHKDQVIWDKAKDILYWKRIPLSKFITGQLKKLIETEKKNGK